MYVRYLFPKRAARFLSSIRVRMMRRKSTTIPVTRRNQFAATREIATVSNAAET
jgi:hypothetical protein